MVALMAWRNVWRRPIRSALSVGSMAFVAALLVFMLSFQLGVYDSMESNALRLLDGFAQIQPPGYAADPDLAKTIDKPQALASAAQALPGITAAAPHSMSYVILSNGDLSFGAALRGVDPVLEPRVSTLAATIKSGRYLRAGDSDAIVMGDVLARDFGAAIGDRVTLLGSAPDGSLAVDSLLLVGLFHTGIREIDRQVAEMPLDRFQATFSLGDAANAIVLVGRRLQDVEAAEPALRTLAGAHGLSLLDWGTLDPSLKQAITLDFSTAMFWYASLVVVVVFITLNTLLMSALERTREFGTLLAIGMRAPSIGLMLWLELIALTVLGCGLGIAIGGGGALWFELHGLVFGGLEGLLSQWGLPGRLYPSLSPTSALAGPVLLVVSVAIAGVVPYRRILRLEPVSAMRSA